MKKSMMVVAAVVGLGLGVVHGEDMVGFDSKVMGTMSFMEAIKNTDPCQNDKAICEQLKPTAVSVGNTGLPVFSPRLFSPTEIMAMNASIESAIAYANGHQSFTISADAARLLRDGTPAQKFEFVNMEEGSLYRFPDNIDKASSVRCGCIKWGTTQECLDKNVCKNICTAGQVTCHIGSYIAGTPQWICGAGAAACSLVCSIVPVCTSTPICLGMSDDCEPTHG